MKTKKFLALVLAFALVAAIAVPSYAVGREIRIKSADELRKLAAKCRLDTYSQDLTVFLDNDISLGNEPFEPFASFSGVFDGRGHTISGVTLSTDGAHQGFFRYIQEGGWVKDLNIEGTVNPSNIRTEVGGLVGTNYGLVENCSFSGEVHGLEKVGGIAGYNCGTVRDSSFAGSVAGKRYTGGIAGYSEGLIDGCTNNGDVNTTIETAPMEIDSLSLSDLTDMTVVSADDSSTVTDSGGIVGLSTGIVQSCLNTGTVGYQHYGYNVGGIAGRQSGYINGCENRGDVRGRKDIGGIVGQMEPYLSVSETGNLIDELKLLSASISVAMAHLDANSAAAGDIMDDIGGDVDNAIDNAEEMDKNSESPKLPENQPGDDEGGDEEIDWGEVKDKADEKVDDAGQTASDIKDKLGDDTIDNITSGNKDNITDEDREKIGEVGGDLADKAGDKIGDKIDERKEEKKAEEKAEQERQDRYDSASGALSGNLGSISGNLARLNELVSDTASQLARDIQVVNMHFYRAMDILGNILTGNAVIYKDISDEDTEELTDGKVAASVNNGGVDGDIGVGGISGEMGIEIEYDLEGVITEKLDTTIISKTFESRCVARNCVNNGTVTGKKNYIGGVTGYTKLGIIIGCEGYGAVESESGSYVGGIVGRSDTIVRESYAMCAVSGVKYVGGIAGMGVKVRSCGSRVSIPSYTASVGAIAGWADVREKEDVPENDERYGSDELYYIWGNTFVSDDLGGVDGVSYAGRAEPQTEEKFAANGVLPLRFREFTVTFKADGTVIADVTGVVDEGIPAEKIPDVPEKAGYTGYWPEFDAKKLNKDTTLEAIYNPNQSSIASSLTSEDNSEMSVVLLSGDFSDCASLAVNAYEAPGPVIAGTEILEQWEYSVENNRGEAGDYSVRYLTPALRDRHDRIEIYALKGDKWVRMQTSESGSYTVFDGSGSSGVFAAVEFPPSSGKLIAIVAAAAAVVVLAAAFFIIKGKKKNAQAPAQTKAAAEAAPEDTAPVAENAQSAPENGGHSAAEAVPAEIKAGEEPAGAAEEKGPAEEEAPALK